MTARTTPITMFSQLARENLRQFLVIERDIESLSGKSDPSEDVEAWSRLISLEELSAKYAFVTIVFSSIALEAYIYDYAARHWSDQFTRDYLDKLDLLSKWILVPRLVTGREIPRNRKWFGLLKNLIKVRNSIVHSKSSEPPVNSKEFQGYFMKIKKINEDVFRTAKQCEELFDALIVEMHKLDPEETVWIQTYLSATLHKPLEAK